MTAPTSAEAAQDLFYEAFANSDVDAMMAIWSQRSDVICIHPGSVALNGFEAIRRSWELILASESMQIQATPVSGWQEGDFASFTVTEHIYVPERQVRGETLATNAFRREPEGWRMVLHHGSPKPAEPHATAGDSGGDIVH